MKKLPQKNCIGEYGLCIQIENKDKFRDLIAGKYHNFFIPEGMMTYRIKQDKGALFDCYGR